MTKMDLSFFSDYTTRLNQILTDFDWRPVAELADDLKQCWQDRRQVFICGNGGSAGNAIHLANDYLYGIAKRTGGGLRVNALPSNSAVMTCLANDVGYEFIFSEQLAVQGEAGDLLICLSGSGNSPNILAALKQARHQNIKTYAILGFSGGKAKMLADVPIHFAVDDMQIAEDLQMVVGHMLMQWLYENRPQHNDLINEAVANA